MKMKSKFFGLNAKLALAVLAVGAMFTGCYDSENGDVTKPYVAPDPVYTVSGTVTDALTGDVIETARVTVSDSKGDLEWKAGTYSVQVNSSGSKTVTVEAEGYDKVTRDITIAPLEKGQASTTVVNVALTKTGAININNVKVSVGDPKAAAIPKVLKPEGEEFKGLDLTADENEAVFVRNFKVVVGAVTDPEDIEEAFAGAPSGLIDYAKSYLGALIGMFGKAQQIEVPYTISIPPYQCVEDVTITYNIVETLYTFEYKGDIYNVSVKGVRTYTFSTNFVPNHNFSHTHGHGHGENGALNAGGGILTSEM